MTLVMEMGIKARKALENVLQVFLEQKSQSRKVGTGWRPKHRKWRAPASGTSRAAALGLT